MIFPNGRKRRHGRRRSFARHNPVHRRRSFARRNPAGGIGGTIFDRDTMAVAGGVVIGTVGTNLLLNSILLPNASGTVPFALPGVNMSQANYMNSLPVALYKFAIGAGAGYLLRNSTPRLAQGLVIGAFASAITSVLQSTNALSSLPGGANAFGTPATVSPGVSRYFRPPGVRSYTPGVSPVFTGPASGFLSRGSPMGLPGARRGMGALFNRHTVRTATAMIPNPFGN